MLIGDAVKAYVGPKRKCYTVHKALLTRYNLFRDQINKSASSLESRDSIFLSEEDPKAFELLISWLYRKSLKAISTIDEGIAGAEGSVYVELYLRACQWGMLDLQIALIDQLRFRGISECGFFPPKLIGTIYAKLEPHSPLRLYIVDSFVYKGVQWEKNEMIPDPTDIDQLLTRKRALKTQLDAGNQEFVLDCYEAMFQLCTKSNIRDPDLKAGCIYHTHEDGKLCSR